MAMQLNCDGCYKRLNELPESAYTVFAFSPYEEIRGSAKRSKTVLFHFCNECLIKEKRLHISVDNPYYVAPLKQPETKEGTDS